MPTLKSFATMLRHDLCGVALPLLLAALPAAAQAPGAPIVIGGEVTGTIDTFLASGQRVETFDGDFDILDKLAVGDVDGDGSDEILVAEDTSTDVEIFRAEGLRIRSWDSSYGAGDGFAVGDLNGDGRAEIVVANNVGGNVDIYDLNGNLINSFGVNYTINDGFALGDVIGDRADEILVAGDVSGDVDIFDAAGNQIGSFDGNYTINDGFALGDLGGDGHAEILIAGDVLNDCEVFAADGTKLGSFDVGYTILDGFAAGDVNGDGRAEIAVAGDVSGNVDIFDDAGNKIASFDGDYTANDGFAIAPHRRPDRDGDGLLDGWETFGYDADGNGTIDVPLPMMGAKPDHKDLFLELDWAPGQEPKWFSVQLLKRAFRLAPIDAGGIANPDGTRGINLWVDTGALREGGRLVGDDFGGGNEVPPVGCLDGAFYNAKRDNFAPARRAIFRYAVSGDPQNSDPCGGGSAETGGNDFVEFVHGSGSLMHELGHNLGLFHGGDTEANCKPNYLSVMNYDHVLQGIRRIGNDPLGFIIDYSPALTTDDARARAPLPELVENHLDESIVLDPTDHSNRTVFVTPDGAKMLVRMDGQLPGLTKLGLDWNVDGDLDDQDLRVNIDTSDTEGNPPDCRNGSSNSTLSGHRDWDVITLPFRGDGDSANGPVDPVPGREPTRAELEALERKLNTTDLTLALSDAPDPAVAGTDLLYTIAVDNRGLNPASQPRVVDTLPAGVSPSGLPGCTATGATLTCDLAEIEFRARAELAVRVRIAPDLVYNAGGPTTLTNTASVENLRGPDRAPANNRASVDTRVVAVADLAMLGIGSPLDPAEVLIGKVTPVTVFETLTNRGPSAPMDATLRRTATAPPDSTITPASSTATAVAVGLQEVRRMETEYAMKCGGVGQHPFRFETKVSPARPDDTDPDPGNDAAALNLDVDCVVPVVIIVRSTINLGTNGVIPVEVLSTRAGEHGTPVDFDATTIDPATIHFGPRNAIWTETGGAPEMHGTGHGSQDRIFHFRTQETGLARTDTEGCVKGKFTDPSGARHKFFGCAPIRIVGR